MAVAGFCALNCSIPESMEAVLSIKAGLHSGRTYRISEHADVGSGLGCDIRLPDAGVAEAHFSVRKSGAGFVIRDLGSGGGTFLDGSRIGEAGLPDKSTIYAGEAVLYARIVNRDALAEAESSGNGPAGIENEVRRIYESSVISLVEDRAGPSGPLTGAASTPLEAVYRIGRLLSSDRDLGGIFEQTVEIAGGALGAGRCFLMLKDAGKGAWKAGARWAAGGNANPAPLPPEKVLDEVQRTGMSMLIHDARGDSRFDGAGPVGSAVCAPLAAGKKSLGVLWADAPGLSLGEDHLRLIAAVGRQAGGGIERRMLEWEIREHSRTLEARVRSRTQELDETLSSLARAQARLIRAEKFAAVGLMAQGIAHNLSTPLAGIKGYAQLLAAEHPGLSEAGKILNLASKLEEIVDTLMRKGALESRTEATPLDLNEIASGILSFFEGDMFYKHEVRRIWKPAPSLPRVRGVYGDFSQALQNLVANGIDALRESKGDRVLSVETGSGPEGVFVAVADSGPGIAPEVEGRLFTPFFTTKAPRGQGGGAPEGTGLGLFSAAKLLEPWGGRIELDRGKPMTTFRIVVPPAGTDGRRR